MSISKRMGAILVAAMSAGSVLAGESVFDDAAFWLCGAHDFDGRGWLDQGDCRDVRHYADADHPLNQAVPTGYPWYYTPCEKQQVVHPYAMITNEETCVRLQQHVEPDGEGIDRIYPAAIQLPPTFAFGYLSNCTAVIRFKWDGPTASGCNTYLFTLGMGKGSVDGIAFGVRADGTVFSYFGSGDMQNYSTSESVAIHPNVWVDLAVAVGDGKVSVYRMMEDYNMPNGQWYVYQDAPMPASALAKPTATGDKFLIGAPGSLPDYGVRQADYSSAWQVLRGSVQQFAIWPRTLSACEIAEAFGMKTALLKSGVFDGSSGEFAGAASSGAQEKPEDWRERTAQLTEEMRTVSYDFNVYAHEAGLPQVLDFRAVETSAEGSFGVSVNGEEMSDCPLEGGRLRLWLPDGTFKEGLNTLALTWKGSGAVTIDAIRLGGSWQLGLEDDSRGEFKTESNRYQRDYYMMFPETWGTRVNPNVTTSADYTDLTIHFSLPGSLAANSRFRLDILCRTGWSEDGTPQWITVAVNGRELATRQMPITWGGKLTFDFSEGELLGGENRITVMNSSKTSSTIEFDCYRLTVKKPRVGSVMFLR